MRRATASLKRVRGCSLDWESWCEVQRGDYKIQGWQSKDATLNRQRAGARTFPRYGIGSSWKTSPPPLQSQMIAQFCPELNHTHSQLRTGRASPEVDPA